MKNNFTINYVHWDQRSNKKTTITYWLKISCKIIKDHSYNNFQVFWSSYLLYHRVITCVLYKEILLKLDNNKFVGFFIFALRTLAELTENEVLFWKTWMNRK